jgi:hypothetical protein
MDMLIVHNLSQKNQFSSVALEEAHTVVKTRINTSWTILIARCTCGLEKKKMKPIAPASTYLETSPMYFEISAW